MADWIKMRVNLSDHPKVVAISFALSATNVHTVGALHRIWSIWDQFGDEDEGLAFPTSYLDTAVDTPGFCDALKEVGWLEERDGKLYLPNWQEHNGPVAKQRAVAQKRMQSSRKKRTSVALKTNTSATRVDKSRVDIKKVPKKIGSTYSDDFETFWSSYPKRVAKGAAWKAWAGALVACEASKHRYVGVSADETPAAFLARRAAVYAKSDAAQDRRYTANPATWLNECRWDDEHKSVAPVTSEHNQAESRRRRDEGEASQVENKRLAERDERLRPKLEAMRGERLDKLAEDTLSGIWFIKYRVTGLEDPLVVDQLVAAIDEEEKSDGK